MCTQGRKHADADEYKGKNKNKKSTYTDGGRIDVRTRSHGDIHRIVTRLD